MLKEWFQNPEYLWVFDYDLTLYGRDEAYVLHSMDIYISEFVQKQLQLNFAEANRLRQQYWQKYGTTLAGLRKQCKVDPQKYFDYIHSGPCIQKPKNNPKLQSFLKNLPNKPWIFTNGRKDWVEMGLETMGVHFDDDKIIDIETLKWGGKPSQEAFDIAMDKINWSPNKVVFLEDKIENLERAQANHWNTILLDPKTPKKHKSAHFHFNHIQELIHEVIR